MFNSAQELYDLVARAYDRNLFSRSDQDDHVRAPAPHYNSQFNISYLGSLDPSRWCTDKPAYLLSPYFQAKSEEKWGSVGIDPKKIHAPCNFAIDGTMKEPIVSTLTGARQLLDISNTKPATLPEVCAKDHLSPEEFSSSSHISTQPSVAQDELPLVQSPPQLLNSSSPDRSRRAEENQPTACEDITVILSGDQQPRQNSHPTHNTFPSSPRSLTPNNLSSKSSPYADSQSMQPESSRRSYASSPVASILSDEFGDNSDEDDYNLDEVTPNCSRKRSRSSGEFKATRPKRRKNNSGYAFRAPVQERQFPCPFEDCMQVCFNSGDLKRHLESASHAKPKHKCDACEKAFTRSDPLKRHLEKKRCPVLFPKRRHTRRRGQAAKKVK